MLKVIPTLLDLKVAWKITFARVWSLMGVDFSLYVNQNSPQTSFCIPLALENEKLWYMRCCYSSTPKEMLQVWMCSVPPKQHGAPEPWIQLVSSVHCSELRQSNPCCTLSIDQIVSSCARTTGIARIGREMPILFAALRFRLELSLAAACCLLFSFSSTARGKEVSLVCCTTWPQSWSSCGLV